MHNFGKLKARPAQVQVFDEDTDKLVAQHDILMLFDKDGVEWHDLFKSFPKFDLYVAVDENNAIVSMETDPEHSQIEGVDIWGCDAAPFIEFTRGSRGTIYGKIWDGVKVSEPPSE